MTGQTISHYRLGERLGRGGMGIVYAAEDLRLGRRVAIKFLSDEACCDPEAVQRFLREARAISSLNHPHICTLHDIGEHRADAGSQPTHFMVMELLEGEPLKSRIARGPLPIDEVLLYGEHIADALDAAHRQGIVHRDLKPANLFVTRRGQLKVLDFGVAKLTEAAHGSALDETTAVDLRTTTGSAIGTIQYMSPEQARGQEIDARSDLFSLGAVIDEMITGQPSFPGTTPAVVFDGILRGTPMPPSQRAAEVPPELDRLVLRALEKDRELRYQSAADMRAELRRLRKASEMGASRAWAAESQTGDGAQPSGPATPTPAAWVRGEAPPAPAVHAGGRTRRMMWLVAPVLTLVAVGGFVLWRSTAAPALADRDTVVLADFTNRTGDSMFDETLSEALGVQLRQSPFLNLLNEQQQQATLRLMGREPTAPLTPEVGREVCQRVGAKALLGGSIASLGSAYLLTLNAQDCVTGEVLAEEQVQATAKEGVLGALSGAVSQFRERLGESLASIQRYDAPVEQASTSSLEALKAYSRGTAVRRTQGDFESVSFFRRAIELDPSFALAYARLGTVYSNIGEQAQAREATDKAYELRERVSDRERYYIEARYFSTVVHDPARAIDAYQLLLSTYPGDYAARTNIGTLLRTEGRLNEAVPMLESAVRAAPNQPNAHLNLGYTLLDLDRHAEARTAFEQGLRLQDSTTARIGLYLVATHLDDTALAAEQVEAVRGRRDELNLTGTRVQVALYQGRMREARRLAAEWTAGMVREGRSAFLGEPTMGIALSELMLGLPDEAARRHDEAKRLGYLTAEADDERLVYAAEGRQPALAREVLGRLRKTVADDKDGPIKARMYDALLAVAEGRPADGVQLLDPPLFQRRYAQALVIWTMAQVRAGRPADALPGFEFLLKGDGRLGVTAQVPWLMVEHARALAKAGRAAEARQAYAAFLAFWKNADADVPLLVAARAEVEEM